LIRPGRRSTNPSAEGRLSSGTSLVHFISQRRRPGHQARSRSSRSAF